MNADENKTGPEDHFVAALEKFVKEDDRAPLAALRRGLGKSPGEAAEALRYVLPHMPRGATQWDEDAYFLTGTLFALHQINWLADEDSLKDMSNLGASFARLNSKVEGDSVEKRFVALLNCHRDDLPTHLRHAVSLLKSKDVPIDWALLLRDVRKWNREDRGVQRRWARAFWSNSGEEEMPTDVTNEQDAKTYES